MRAVFVAAGIDGRGIGNGRRVKAGLVRTRIEQAAHIFHGAHAAAHGQWNKDLGSHGFDDGQDQVTPIAGGGNVQKGQLVRALCVVARGDFDGIACIAQLQKIDAFDDATTGNVQTGNDAFGEHEKAFSIG